MADIPQTDIIAWNFGLRRTGGSSASLVVDNTSGRYGSNNVGDVVTLRAIRDSITYPLYKGKVKTVSPTFSLNGQETVSMSIVSLFESLEAHPVTTETITDMTAKELFEYVLGTFGAMNLSHADFTVDGAEVFSKINISEDSIIVALKKLTEACNLELFVDSTGKLITQEVKASPTVEYTFESTELFDDLSITTSDYPKISAVRVRGRYQMVEELVTDVVSSGKISFTTLDTERIVIDITVDKNFSSDQVKSAIVEVISGANAGKVIDFVEERKIKVEFFGIFSTTEINTIEYTIKIPAYVELRMKLLASLAALGLGAKEPRPMAWLSNGFYPSTMWNEMASGRGGGGQWNEKTTVKPPPMYSLTKQKIKNPDELADYRIEEVVSDSALIDKIGLRYAVVDNCYIQDSAMAGLIGNRMLSLSRMSSKTVSFSGVWNPLVTNVNMIVSIPKAYTGGTVIALIDGIDVSFDVGTSAITSRYDCLVISDSDDDSSDTGVQTS